MDTIQKKKKEDLMDEELNPVEATFYKRKKLKP